MIQCNKRFAVIWFFLFVFISVTVKVILSETKEQQYLIQKDVLDQGGGTSTSANYILTDAIGQSSPNGSSSSENYHIMIGFFTGFPKFKAGFWADVDDDGDVDIIDIQLVAAHWNTRVGDPNYDPRYDVDNEGQGDGDIDIIDIQLVASWWNKPIPTIAIKLMPKPKTSIVSQGCFKKYE